MAFDWGRETTGNLEEASSREWLVTNGIGGFASGTIAGLPTRRYHGLLVAALKRPVGRTVLVGTLDERVSYQGTSAPLSTYRWADGTIAPRGHVGIERFRLDGTTPVWTFAVGDALIEKRVFMEQGKNRTYVTYRLQRGCTSVDLELKALVNYRDYHATTHSSGWQMRVDIVPHGVRVAAYDEATPFYLLSKGAAAETAHAGYTGFQLDRERERGLDFLDDQLHAATFRARLEPGEAVTLVFGAETTNDLDGDAAWTRRLDHEAAIRGRFAEVAGEAPEWIQHLALASDQFIVDRADGKTIVAGYHWFSDWGRDTMISLPGLTLSTGRPEVARSILRTFAKHVDRGMLPNRFPDAGEAPEYNTVDATLWYFGAIRACHETTEDDALLEELYPVLEDIVEWHERGTRYGIKVDPEDGLLRSGEPGVQLTWMDAKVGDWVVTPRTGKAVEINALWLNALSAMAGFARRLKRDPAPWESRATRVRKSFARFWNDSKNYCYDVIDGPKGHDDALRPNQIYAVSLRESGLSEEQRRRVVDVCGRHLLTSFGLRSLSPEDPAYRGRYEGSPTERDGRYHQGTTWGFLLGPYALAHLRVYGDVEAARSFLQPMAHHLEDYGLGSIAEIFDGDAPFEPRGCMAQAWSVSETLRAWMEIERFEVQGTRARGATARRNAYSSVRWNASSSTPSPSARRFTKA